MSQDHSTKVLFQIKDPNITDLVVQEPAIHKNYDYGRLSNGSIEGMNCKIKQIKRTAYGYKN